MPTVSSLSSGDDYIAVDDGYAKEKRTRNHSTLLIDGRGQYAEGTKNAFRGLDADLGRPLGSKSWEYDNMVYARGEAARAYHARFASCGNSPAKCCFSRATPLYCAMSVSADRPHHCYDWLLQTDAPPETNGHGSQFAIKNGASGMPIAGSSSQREFDA